jgi:hypothetical protein
MTKAPWHFWLVAILALVWNGYGGYDYLMTQTRNPGYLAMYTPAQIAYFDSLSIGEQASWGLGVWSAVAGSVLMILRKKLAVAFFLLQLVGIAGMLLYTYVLNAEAAKVMGSQGPIFSAVITVIGLFLAWYGVRMKKQGVLA